MHGEAIPLSNLDNRSNGLLSSDSPSQEEFADKLGMSPSTVKRLEADKRKIAANSEVASKLKSGEIPFSEAILSTRHLSY
jgi:DNA-binding XRE family transcriptional regulator